MSFQGGESCQKATARQREQQFHSEQEATLRLNKEKYFALSQLRTTNDRAMCITRRKYGRGFQYFDEYGAQITSKKVLRRFRQLVIPPMWSEVKVCKWPDGHIQATGRDPKGRKQYIYHSAWEQQRQREKFNRMSAFGQALPGLRRRCQKLVSDNATWSREKVLGLMLLILDETGIRIGNQEYAERNDTYGLSTLRRRHLTMARNGVRFEYQGKSGKQRRVAVEEARLAKHIREAAELPGYEIFRYRNGSRKWENVDSEEVNAFIQAQMGEGFSSKDFRTWVASRLAVAYFPEAQARKEKRPRQKLVNILLRLVAKELGNTPNVCRTHYVHPAVLQAVEGGKMPALNGVPDAQEPHAHSRAERLLLDLI